MILRQIYYYYNFYSNPNYYRTIKVTLFCFHSPPFFSSPGDAKNLLGGGGQNGANGTSAGKRDVYCTIALDQEEIYRTMQERTLSPFFDELFEFEVPRKFRYLSLYVWQRDGHLKQQDRPVGKIAIRREELHLYNNKDHWFPLRPVDADSEVQGMVNIRVTIDHGAGPSTSRRQLPIA